MQFSLNIGMTFFGIYLTIILILLRIVRNISPTIIVCTSAIFVYSLGLIVISITGWHVYFFSFSSIYWFLTLTLLMIFGAVYKSISLRMMLHLLHKPDKTDFYATILQNYIKNQSYLNRIDILLEKKLIKQSGNASFNLTKRGNRFARQLWLMQKLFCIKESG